VDRRAFIGTVVGGSPRRLPPRRNNGRGRRTGSESSL